MPRRDFFLYPIMHVSGSWRALWAAPGAVKNLWRHRGLAWYCMRRCCKTLTWLSLLAFSAWRYCYQKKKKERDRDELLFWDIILFYFFFPPDVGNHGHESLMLYLILLEGLNRRRSATLVARISHFERALGMCNAVWMCLVWHVSAKCHFPRVSCLS